MSFKSNRNKTFMFYEWILKTCKFFSNNTHKNTQNTIKIMPFESNRTDIFMNKIYMIDFKYNFNREKCFLDIKVNPFAS